MYKRQVQTAEELEEQTGEEPIKMVEQTEKPEPETITGSVDANMIMMMTMLQKSNEQMFQRMEEKMNKNTESLNENTKKSNEQMFQKMEETNKNNCLLYTSRCV